LRSYLTQEMESGSYSLPHSKALRAEFGQRLGHSPTVALFLALRQLPGDLNAISLVTMPLRGKEKRKFC